MSEQVISLESFLNDFRLFGNQLMWFLGAGASRGASLPTATDLIWDLKKRYYSAHENQKYDSYDLNSEAIKSKIQSYLISKGFPELWSDEEYSFYFELAFGKDYKKQQRYIQSALAPEKVSLNVGNRVFAALIKLGIIRVAFTTNFDSVVEQAYSKVSEENLDSYNIEGSCAALSALNNESFPIYVKLHGDFRYQSIKNLSQDLQSNDEELKKCFLAASSRFGLVISGYSGRDSNVMSMLEEALELPNAFPHGIFWTVPSSKYIEKPASQFIQLAREKGVNAFVVETGTFDEFLSKIWRQISEPSSQLNEAVKLSSQKSVSVPLPAPGSGFPVLRTNMLPVSSLKLKCGAFKLEGGITFSDLKECAKSLDYRVVYTYTDKMLYWGNENDAVKVIPNYRQQNIEHNIMELSVSDVENDSFIKGFVEEGILDAISQNTKGIRLRKSRKRSYLVIAESYANSDEFAVLRKAVGFKGEQPIAGSLNRGEVVWSECLEVGLEVNGKNLYLFLKPDIWIKPLKNRGEYSDFLKSKQKNRYNSTSYRLLDAWIQILFGGTRSNFSIKNPKGADFSPEFEILTRTAYSRRG